MKTATPLSTFATEEHAWQYMVQRNREQPHATPVVLIAGPDANYAVVDMTTAIEMNALYTWEV